MVQSTEKDKKSVRGIFKVYLFAYNFFQTLGWSYLLFQLLTYYVNETPNKNLFENVKWTVIVFQNAAVLEILHAVFKIVPSNPLVILQQMFARVMLVCGVLLPTLEGRSYYGLPLALFAWSVAEIIRYTFYALNIIGSVPYILTWLRYTAFIILYPIGLIGELLCLYGAYNEVTRNRMWSIDLPNSANFSFQYAYFILSIMLLYLPLVFPRLYLHMFTLRKKVLGGGESFAKKQK